MTQTARIVRLTDLPDWRIRVAALDAIFFVASATQGFRDAEARSVFRERWLGRYLQTYPHLAHVALDAGEAILGYIAGAYGDAALDPMFADIGYWPAIAHLTSRYPAHLHINLAAAARNRGVGSQLIEAFLSDARAAGVPGVHLVTGRNSRNRSFYTRNGFVEVAALDWGGTPIVMLARQT